MSALAMEYQGETTRRIKKLAHLLNLGRQFYLYPYYLEWVYLKNYSFCSFKDNFSFVLSTEIKSGDSFHYVFLFFRPMWYVKFQELTSIVR